MSRPKLSSSAQSPLVRWTLRCYELAASLSLAVILIFSSAVSLGLATFIEAAYGTPVVQFYVYQTWWFELILILLAVNIFCAAAIRYPWKRHQTGFVITHIGLLTLLLGAFIGRSKGIDAQVSVFEGQMDKWAIDNAVNLQLNISQPGEKNSAIERVEVNFQPGLYNWSDWSKQFAWEQPGDENIASSNYFSWKLFRSFCGKLFSIAGQNGPGDLLYNRNGVRLEVLDYYSDARAMNAPSLQFRVSTPPETRTAADGTQTKKAPGWVPVELSVLALPDQPEYPFGWSERQLRGGGYFSLQLGGSDAQTQAFLKSAPEGPLGKQGQVVLYHDGKLTRFLVEDKLGQGKFKLTGSDNLSAEVLEYWPAASLTDAGAKLQWRKDPRETQPLNPAVKIQLYRDDKPQHELVLLALESHSNVQDHQGQVYGEYWYDHSSMTFEERQKNGITARIDFLSGHDLKLYYRYWNREQVVFARECPTDGSQDDAVDAFKMPIAQLKLYVTQYVPSETPRVIPVKQDFVKDRLIGDPMMGGRMPAAKFKLTMDDKSEEFWLFPHLATPESAPTSRPNSPKRIEIMEGKAGRVAALTMPIKAIDIGFRVRLAKFERKLDPGTDQPSHYASWVDFVDQTADRAIYSLASSKGSARSYIVPELKQPTALAYDAKRDDLYWIDARAKEIRRAKWSDIQQDAKSAKVETVVAQGLRKPTALVVDSEHELLFWADTLASGRDEIGVIRSATTTGDKLATIAEVRHTPQAITLDSDAKVLYFASRGQNSIGRASYDGEETDVAWYTSATRPTGLALHAAKQQLYWCELGKNAIFRLDVRNPNNKPLTISRKTGVEPIALAIDGKNERLAFFETLPKPAVTADGLPTSKPHVWQLTSVQFDGDDERLDCDDTVDEPQSLVFDKAGHALWTQTATTRTDVWITMNAPVDCYDPTTGRSYRLFQERFAGPFKPGQQITERMAFEDLVPPDSRKHELYESILTVNYDPGRGIRNVGCLLICIGIGTMFYMRAYFFKPKARVVTKPVAAHMV